MPDPFSVFDSLDPFSRLNAFPRGRAPAAYPPLDDADTESAISKLTRGTLSGLGYVGSTLDKLTGARALRGLAAGKGREALSVIPGSDALFGLTNEADTTSMDDLLRQHLGYDPSKGNWAERNLLGPGLEIAADPGTWFGGIGAVTRLGKLASKTAPVARSLEAVRAGQRSLHPLVGAAEYGAQKLGLSTPAEPAVQRAAANLAEWTGGKVGAGARGLNVGVRKAVPLVASAQDFLAPYAKRAELTGRAWFEPEAGFTTNAPTQQANREIRFPQQKAMSQEAARRHFDLQQEKAALIRAGGVAPDEANRYLRQLSEDIEPSLPLGQIGPVASPEAMGRLRTLAEKNKAFGRDEPLAMEQALGLEISPLQSVHGYNLRQAYKVPGTRPTGFWSRLTGGQKKQFPTGHPSMLRRDEDITNWLGGTTAIEDLATKELAGPVPTLSPKAVKQKLLEDQFTRLTAGPQGIPLAPDLLDTLGQRATGMRRFLRQRPIENVLGGVPGAERMPIFGIDPIADSLLRQQRAIGSTTSGRALFDVMRQAAPMARGKPGDVPLTDILRSTKLNTEEGVTNALRAVGMSETDIGDALAEMASQAPADQPFDVKGALSTLLGGHALPAEEARASSKLLNRWQTPEEWQPILNALDTSLGAFKTGAYSIWPGSLVRNIMSGQQQNLVMGGMTPFTPMRGRYNAFREGRAVDLGIPDLAHLTPDQQRIALAREVVAYPHLSGHNQGTIGEAVGMDAPSVAAADPLARQQGYRETAAQLQRSIQTKGWWGLGDIPAIGQQLNTIAEARLRMPEYMHLRSKGYTPDRAAQVVQDTHFDYSHLTTPEKTVFKRLAPFYTFSRFNIPKQIGQAITRPATIGGPIRFSGMLQGQGEGEGYVPEYLRSGLALPMGSLTPGTERYLSALGLPLEEAFGRLKIGANPVETAAKTGEGLLAMLRPGIRAPLEMMTGKQFFSGRDLKDLHIGNIENFLSGGNETAGQLLSELTGASPAGRGLSTLNKFVDPRKYAGGPAHAAVALGLPFFSGLRVSDVDTEKWAAIDARNQLERELAASPHVKQSKDYFVPKDVRLAGDVTPQEAIALRTYAALKQRAKEAQEQQRRVGVRVGQ